MPSQLAVAIQYIVTKMLALASQPDIKKSSNVVSHLCEQINLKLHGISWVNI